MDTEELEEQPTLMQHAMKFGIIIGIASVALTVIMYVIDPLLLINWKFGLLLLLIIVGIVAWAGIKYRNEIGGFMSFGTAYKHGFVLFVVMGVISTLFSLLLHTVIDPDLKNVLIEGSIAQTEAMMEGFGADAASIDQAIEEGRENIEQQFEVAGIIKGFGWSLLIYLVVSLITGAIAKKSESIDMQS